ncbi:MAG: hypothetical protein OEL79_05460 [Chromatiales bacterium]|nr:hypothetical protein [Chromatiales bacterium]
MSNLKEKVEYPILRRRADRENLISNALWRAEKRHQPSRHRLGWILFAAAVVIISNIIAVTNFSG